MDESTRLALNQMAHVPMSTPLENYWSENSCPNFACERNGPRFAQCEPWCARCALCLHSDQWRFRIAIGTLFPCEVALNTFHTKGHSAVEGHFDTMLLCKSKNATIDIVDLRTALCKNIVTHAALICLV